MVLKINMRPYTKLYHYVKFAPGEVSALGKIRKEGNDYIVTDVYIIDQVCTGASTVLKEDALADFVYNLAISGKKVENYCLWFHSHGNMDVFWSGIDEDNILRLKTEYPIISLLMNKEGSMIARIDVVDELPEELKVVVIPNNRTGIVKKCRNEVKNKVTHLSQQPSFLLEEVPC